MSRKRVSRKSRGGFTLLEVLLVLAILVILGSLVTVYFVGTQESAYRSAAKTQIAAFETAITKYRLQTGQYPTKLDDLVHLPQGMTQDKWQGPHLEAGRELPKDPWGHDYVYTVNSAAQGTAGKAYTIRSWGPNGIANDADDVTNLAATTTGT